MASTWESKSLGQGKLMENSLSVKPKVFNDDIFVISLVMDEKLKTVIRNKKILARFNIQDALIILIKVTHPWIENIGNP